MKLLQALHTLQWYPELGVGTLRVDAQPYDADYFANYQRLAQTQMGRELTRLRRELVDQWAGPDTLVVDVGIGSGQFLLSRPNTWGFDINPVAVNWLRERTAWVNPYDDAVPALTFWDSLEHIPLPGRLLENARDWVFVSCPIVPGNGPPPAGWKHFKPREHCWYWTREGLIGWMQAYGFACVAHNTAETIAGREDIGSFAFWRG